MEGEFKKANLAPPLRQGDRARSIYSASRGDKVLICSSPRSASLSDCIISANSILEHPIETSL